MKTRKPYKFGGRRHPFSNFYPAPVTFEGISFANGEAAFQSAKTIDMDERRSFANIDPGNAKGRGRRLKLRPDWEQVKYGVMLEVLRSKFQEPGLQRQLLSTGERLIIEDTTGWHDNEWGNCGCPKCQNKTGKNLLGKALMEVRKEMRDKMINSLDRYSWKYAVVGVWYDIYPQSKTYRGWEFIEIKKDPAGEYHDLVFRNEEGINKIFSDDCEFVPGEGKAEDYTGTTIYCPLDNRAVDSADCEKVQIAREEQADRKTVGIAADIAEIGIVCERCLHYQEEEQLFY
jgi:ribA/ribD-fused uncharacterized protein